MRRTKKSKHVLYDWVARRKLSPFAKLLYTEICNATFNLRDNVYKFSAEKGAARIGCSRKQYFKVKAELESKGLISQGDLFKYPGGKCRPRTITPLFNPEDGDATVKLWGAAARGKPVSLKMHREWLAHGSIPIFCGAGQFNAIDVMVFGVTTINPGCSISSIARFLNITRDTAKVSLDRLYYIDVKLTLVKEPA